MTSHVPFRITVRESAADETALRDRAQRIARALVGIGTTHAVGVPDNASRFVFEFLESDASVQVVPVCREGEAWSLASGLWVGGAQAVVIIQNTGFLESGDALRGTAIQMGVPLVALLGYRGHRSLSGRDPDSAASFFEPTLRAWGLPYHFLADQDEEQIFKRALAQARSRRGPVAVLMT